MFGRFWNAAWNFSFTTFPAPAAIAAFAAAWSSLTVASEAPQDRQVTIDELLASLGVTNEVLPHFAQVRMLGDSFHWLGKQWRIPARSVLNFQPKSDNRAYCSESPVRLRLLVLTGENDPQGGQQNDNGNRCLHQLG
jgi:hypothetical protein